MRGGKVEFGDWQTPAPLAKEVAMVASRFMPAPRTVFEPTCGKGAFVHAACETWPDAEVVGFELNPAYVGDSRRSIGALAEVRRADFFSIDWAQEISAAAAPILVIGNPPWVTSSTLGRTGATNHPPKRNFKGLRGMDARTGPGNFDVSEWMILQLIDALRGKPAVLAMLCTSAVARRVLEHVELERWDVHPGGLFRIDAAKHFHVAVDAVLLVCATEAPREAEANKRWAIYRRLDAPSPSSFEARIFWDAKRPINKGVLQALELGRLGATCLDDDRATSPQSSR